MFEKQDRGEDENRFFHRDAVVAHPEAGVVSRHIIRAFPRMGKSYPDSVAVDFHIRAGTSTKPTKQRFQRRFPW